MEPENRQRIQQKESFLRKNLYIDRILSDLIEQSVIDTEDEERIRCENTQGDRVRKFLRILERKSPGTYEKFRSVLEDENQFILEELDGCKIDEEALQRSRQTTDERIHLFLQQNYEVEDRQTVSVAVLIDNLKEDFIRQGEIYFPEEDHITRMIQTTFKRVVKKKDRKKKEFMFYNLKRVKKVDDSDEDATEDQNSETLYDRRYQETQYSNDHRNDDDHPLPADANTTLNTRRMDDLSTFELFGLIKPKLCENAIDEGIIKKTLEEEEIEGKAFKHLDISDVKELFPTMKFGKRKLLLVIRDELLKEEENRTSQQDVTSQNKSVSFSEEKTMLPKQSFRETFRRFASSGKGKDSYRKGAVVNTSNTRVTDLIEPIHRFLLATHSENPSIPDWIAEESVKFASACMNERTNGTIHFGICDKKTEKHNEGEIIGIHVEKSSCQEQLNRMIRDVFYKDQQETAFRCIRSIQFVDVFTLGNKSELLSVVEIDIVPESELIGDEAFYIRIGKKATLFKFEKGTSVPVCISEEDVRNFMKTKTELTDLRKRRENGTSHIEIKEDLRRKFLNLFTGGDEVLSHEIYPLLFLSPIDSSMSQIFIDENFKFIVDIDANAVFDFDPSSDVSGIYNFYENIQEQIVKAFTTENFDRNNEENRGKKDKYNSMLEDLRTSSVKPWVFCNGYETMEKEPYQILEWKQKRSEGFKEALRFFHNEIPNERAFVLFLIFSKNYDIMLEAADEVLVKFKDQWMVIAANEDIAHTWMDEIVRRKIVDQKTLSERSLIGMPWQHVNKMFKDALLPQETTKCEIITSTGAFCTLREKVKNELFDLNVLSRKECEDSDIIFDNTKREQKRRQVEENFFKGGEVTWWNLWFSTDHVLQRSQHKTLLKMVRDALKGDRIEEDNNVGIVNLFHQPGAGGTTSAKQILWDLKEEYRCCVVKQITEDTCEQITTLRNYEDPESPKPVLALIDNGDDEKIQGLYTRLENRAWVATRRHQTQFKVFCVLLLCTRRANLPTKINKHSVSLKHELDEQELAWFKKKSDSLKEDYNTDRGCDPRLLISFNILKENFNEDYIKRAVQEFVEGVASFDEQCLLKYLSLLNTYDVDVKPVPLSAFDPLMQNVSISRKGTSFSYGLVWGGPSRRQRWETRISPSLQILLNTTSRAGLGGQLKALRIINSLFAREILLYLQSKLKNSTSEIVKEFLNSVMFGTNNQSQYQLLGVVKDIMKKREVHESGAKDKFSRLVTEVLEHEDADKAAEILIKVFEMTDDPMIAQQISRLYIHSKNWDKAVKYAITATQMRPQNSYLWDTFAQIYKRQLVEKYTDSIRANEKLSFDDIKEFIRVAFEGIQKFRKEQEVSIVEKNITPNDAGYYGELKIIILMLDIVGLCPAIPKEKLHRFLVDDRFCPAELKFLDQDTMVWLKKLHFSSERTMRTLEEKNTQVKEDIISGVFQNKPRSKECLQELAKIRENLDQYFGEDNNEIPHHLKPDDVPFFIRRRVRRFGGRSLPSILDIGRNVGGKQKLENMYELLQKNVTSKYRDAYDLVTLIGVALVMNIKMGRGIDYNRFVEWSKQLYDIISPNDDRPYLESYLYLVMFHWPTENRDKMNLCTTGKIVEAIKKWRIAFQNRYPRQDGHPGLKKETTYFFLGKGRNMDGLVYYEELLSEHRGRYYKGDTVWRQPHVVMQLKRLNGTLVNEGLEVSVQVETEGGNKTTIFIPTSMPIGRRALWQKRVFFVLGFGWGGPKAYDVDLVDPSKTPSESPVQNQNENPTRFPSITMRAQNSQRENQMVKTHGDLRRKLEEIDKELEMIKRSGTERLSQKEAQSKNQREQQLKKQREELILQRDEFLRN